MKFIKIIAFAILVFVGLFVSACKQDPAPKTEVWLVPNIGSEDFLELFMFPGQWSSALDKVDIFGFHADHFYYYEEKDGCPYCGRNVYKTIMGLDAVKKLTEWDRKISIEFRMFMGANPQDCSDSTFSKAQMIFDNFNEQSFFVSHILVDNPLLTQKQCRFNPNDAIKIASEYMQKMRLLHRAGFPESEAPTIGFRETFPQSSVVQLKDFIGGVIGKGASVSFFHLNVDRTQAKAQGLSDADISSAVVALKDYCKTKKISFGIVMSGETRTGNEVEYRDSVYSWSGLVKNAIGIADQTVFESWILSSDPLVGPVKRLPRNLPQTDSLSHTSILNEVIGALDL